MTRQQLADCLLAHWQLLWPLPPAERMARIAEIEADMIFAEEMQAVDDEMSKQVIFVSDLPPHLSAAL